MSSMGCPVRILSAAGLTGRLKGGGNAKSFRTLILAEIGKAQNEKG